MIASMSPSADNPVIVGRDHEGEKNPGTPPLRCPFCGWSPCKEDKWLCTCGHEWNPFEPHPRFSPWLPVCAPAVCSFEVSLHRS
jgi:hypothetical protein